MQKLLTCFQQKKKKKKKKAYMPYLMIKVLTNDIVSFEQLGPVLLAAHTEMSLIRYSFSVQKWT